jgi:hypothetical protein
MECRLKNELGTYLLTAKVRHAINTSLPETGLKTDDQIFACCRIGSEVCGEVATVQVPPTLVTLVLKRLKA